ncbi:hypothetical protein V1477_014883 [Vespula maculifrons]|uniref:Uncharacterized protein n=1 Tax=Vespula maculifrons TaxID=7453 RepID=A0ABD2BIP9_VESMC
MPIVVLVDGGGGGVVVVGASILFSNSYIGAIHVRMTHYIALLLFSINLSIISIALLLGTVDFKRYKDFTKPFVLTQQYQKYSVVFI